MMRRHFLRTNPQLASCQAAVHRRASKIARNRRIVMSQLVQQLTNNLVVVAATLIALGMGWFSINYLSKRRQMLHQERMASLVKGLHYAGVAHDIFSKPTTDARSHVLSALRWLFGAAGLSAALYGYSAMQPFADPSTAARGALAGVVPGSIGLAHLVFSAFSRNRQKPNFPTRRSYR
jgi:hypothetical protein